MKFGFKKYYAIALIAIILIYAIFVYIDENDPGGVNDFGEYEVAVHFVDVGQADCTIITSPFGNIIIDAGLYEDVDNTTEYIDSIGVTAFTYAIFTHPHSDHIGGAGTIISEYDVDTVILPDIVSTYTPFEKMIEAIENRQCNVIEGKAGVSLELGELSIDILAPVTTYEEINNASIATKITYGEISFLFTGDAENLSEYDMLNRDASVLDATVYKVGHHGSSSSSCKAFIEAVSPETVVYSCGLNNDYGHPHGEVVRLMNSIGAEAYRTDKDGTVIIPTNGKSYYVLTEKQKT